MIEAEATKKRRANNRNIASLTRKRPSRNTTGDPIFFGVARRVEKLGGWFKDCLHGYVLVHFKGAYIRWFVLAGVACPLDERRVRPALAVNVTGASRR